MQRYKFTRKILIIIMTILILLNFYIWVFLPNYNTLELKPHIYKSFDSSFKKVDYSVTMDEAIVIVDNFMKVHYTLEIVEDNGKFLGRNLCCTTYIQIVEQSGWETLWTLTHELVHYKYQSSNETFTNFKTWQLLYESGVSILVARAKYEAYDQGELGGSKNTEYDISWYIVNYLEKEKQLYEIHS